MESKYARSTLSLRRPLLLSDTATPLNTPAQQLSHQPTRRLRQSGEQVNKWCRKQVNLCRTKSKPCLQGGRKVKRETMETPARPQLAACRPDAAYTPSYLTSAQPRQAPPKKNCKYWLRHTGTSYAKPKRETSRTWQLVYSPRQHREVKDTDTTPRSLIYSESR